MPCEYGHNAIMCRVDMVTVQIYADGTYVWFTCLTCMYYPCSVIIGVCHMNSLPSRHRMHPTNVNSFTTSMCVFFYNAVVTVLWPLRWYMWAVTAEYRTALLVAHVSVGLMLDLSTSTPKMCSAKHHPLIRPLMFPISQYLVPCQSPILWIM